MICESCGITLVDAAAYCHQCGKRTTDPVAELKDYIRGQMAKSDRRANRQGITETQRSSDQAQAARWKRRYETLTKLIDSVRARVLVVDEPAERHVFRDNTFVADAADLEAAENRSTDDVEESATATPPEDEEHPPLTMSCQRCGLHTNVASIDTSGFINIQRLGSRDERKFTGICPACRPTES